MRTDNQMIVKGVNWVEQELSSNVNYYKWKAYALDRRNYRD